MDKLEVFIEDLKNAQDADNVLAKNQIVKLKSCFDQVLEMGILMLVFRFTREEIDFIKESFPDHVNNINIILDKNYL